MRLRVGGEEVGEEAGGGGQVVPLAVPDPLSTCSSWPVRALPTWFGNRRVVKGFRLW